MRIKFGRSELVMTEKGMITDITFDKESVFPQGQPSCFLRLFKDNEPVAVRSVALEGDCLVYGFEHMEGRVSVAFTVKEDYTVIRSHGMSGNV